MMSVRRNTAAKSAIPACCKQCDAIEVRDRNWIMFHDAVHVNAEGNFTKRELLHIAGHLEDVPLIA